MLKVTEEIPRTVCTPELLIKLRGEGFNTNGSEQELERIIRKKGFNLPSEHIDDYGRVYYGFRHEQYIRMFFVYVDSLAEEILFLRQFKMI